MPETPDFEDEVSERIWKGLPEDTKRHIFPTASDPYNRGAEVLGIRTRGSGTTEIPIGKIRPKDFLRQIWEGLELPQRYILMLVSDHRHLTPSQLSHIVVASTRDRRREGREDVCRELYRWTVVQRYGCHDMPYEDTVNVPNDKVLHRYLKDMVQDGLLHEVSPSYSLGRTGNPEEIVDEPALYSMHYYLTPRGARVLICNTSATEKGKGGTTQIGYVPTHRNAAFQSIVHETECADVLCSVIAGCEWGSNLPNHVLGDFEVCRFWHEKETEYPEVPYGQRGKIDFKPDGKIVIWSSLIGDFIDMFLEYDSGSSKEKNIAHKVEAFLKYVLWQRSLNPEFRAPMLLLVTQKPASFMPQLMNNRKITTYTTAIKNAVKRMKEDTGDLQRLAPIFIADCASLRENGAMGACWHRVDLTAGNATTETYDMIEAALSMRA